MSDSDLRRVGLALLQSAMTIRDEAQRRVWEAADAVDQARDALARSESKLAVEERSLGDQQELLRMVWEDFNPRTGAVYGKTEAGLGAQLAGVVE